MIGTIAAKSTALLVTVTVLLVAPCTVTAEEDLDVTMRMVMDDDALNETFVQELELPSSLGEPSDLSSFDTLDAGNIAEDARDIEASIAEQSLESRDALGVELPGEVGVSEPEIEVPTVEDPGLELPGEIDVSEPEIEVPVVEDPGLELPGTGDIDLLILNKEPLGINATEPQ